jgi:hypothetical protein
MYSILFFMIKNPIQIIFRTGRTARRTEKKRRSIAFLGAQSASILMPHFSVQTSQKCN